MAARPIWRWPAISASASTAARCSCRRRGSGCIITRAASRVTCRGSASTTPRKLFLTAQKIDAAEMLRIGYLTAMVPTDALDEEVDRLAAVLAGNAPVAMRGMKQRDQRIRPRQARRGRRRPPPSRQHARRRDQGRHQGVRGKTAAEVLTTSFGDSCERRSPCSVRHPGWCASTRPGIAALRVRCFSRSPPECSNYSSTKLTVSAMLAREVR